MKLFYMRVFEKHVSGGGIYKQADFITVLPIRAG